MAKKKSRKQRGVTVKKVVVPPVVTDSTYDLLKAAADLYNNSETCRGVARLDWALFEQKPKYKPSKWELEQIRDFIKKFQEEFDTPLAKALE